jgi:hypothetical protein
LFNCPKSTTLLDAPSRADPAKRVGDLVKSDIFAKGDPDIQDDSAMIFPFLVLEAKRARAPDSLEDIERQMAFPAYEMLRAQNRLLENAAGSEGSDRLPRVWLVSFKAQIWRLYVATMEQDEKEEYNYVSGLSLATRAMTRSFWERAETGRIFTMCGAAMCLEGRMP